MRKLLLLGVLGLAGCVSVEDIRSYEPADRHVVAEDFAELAACMADEYVKGGLNVTPLVSQRNRRATISASVAGYMQTLPFYEIELVGLNPVQTQVSFRRRKTAFGQEAGLEHFRTVLAACVPGWQPPADRS